MRNPGAGADSGKVREPIWGFISGKISGYVEKTGLSDTLQLSLFRNPQHEHSIQAGKRRLREYDSKKSTDFYKILREYLRCERDRVLTAKRLFVHKNTLVYRLKKIVELFSLDLDDAYEREYLMVSFLVMENK